MSVSQVLGLLCHKELWVRKKKRSTWLTLSQRVMGSKREAKYLAYSVSQRVMGSEREAKYLAYFVTESNGFEKGSEVLGLLCNKE